MNIPLCFDYLYVQYRDYLCFILNYWNSSNVIHIDYEYMSAYFAEWKKPDKGLNILFVFLFLLLKCIFSSRKISVNDVKFNFHFR